MDSPCKLICKLDLDSFLCEGCGRSREEIAMWTRYTDYERSFITTQLGPRLVKLAKSKGE